MNELAVFADNLTLWRAQAHDNRELRLLQTASLAERAAEVWRTGGAEGPSAITAHFAPEQGADAPFARTLAVDEQIAFCRAFLAACPDFLPKEPPLLPLPAGSVRVACLAGALSRVTVSAFAPVLRTARLITASSFAAICEEITAGNTLLGLLPIEDTTEGKLRRTYDLLERYDLQILATCTVPSPESPHSMRMALVSGARYALPFASGEQLLECELYGEGADTLSDFLLAAAHCGLSLRRVDAYASPYREDGFFYRPILRTSSEDETRLLEVYIALFQPRASIVGRYIHKKETT